MTVHERSENNKKLKSELNLHFDAGLLNVQSTHPFYFPRFKYNYDDKGGEQSNSNIVFINFVRRKEEHECHRKRAN